MKKLSLIHGWGRTPLAFTHLRMPRTQSEFQDYLSTNNQRGVIATGLQRSYGDSTLNSGGLTLSTRSLNNCEIDSETGIATLGAGLSIRELEVAALKKSLFPPVVPGTGHVTIGGAIAADIHGKSHHITGSFSSSVKRIRLLYSNGSMSDIYPNGVTSEHFWATVGGLGLTGVILEADIQLIKISSQKVAVNEVRCGNLDKVMWELDNANDFAHTVAWIDLSGDFRGRGVVSKANYFEEEISEKRGVTKKSRNMSLPYMGGINFITPGSVRAFNEYWFRKPLAIGTKGLGEYMHPLDQITNWNQVYGDKGFIQYQFVVPDGGENVISRVLAELKKIKAPSCLSVLKRFGEGNKAPLSFPQGGWTLAMDFPTRLEGLEGTLIKFDEWITSEGGRVYLVKDSRAQHQFIPVMYPELRKWQHVRNLMDPNRVWQSDQSRRLQLC